MLPLHLLISPATAPKYPMSQHHQQYGFSLLELVVVMGILAIFASVSLTFVGEKDVQQRYNESLEKLTMVKRNFLSVDKFYGQTVMHGFFVDNGIDAEQGFSIILKNKLDSSKTYNIDKTSYKPFSSTDIYVKASSTFTKVKGATLYKGIRPGAYDLSQYQDADNEIRDAWGEKFQLDTNYIQIKSATYKNFSAKKKIDISYSDLYISPLFIEIHVKNLPLSGKFKIAIASFQNNTDCDKSVANIKNCWKTTLSKDKTAVNQLIFSLQEKSVPASGASFDHTTDLIQPINLSTPQNLTSIEFTTLIESTDSESESITWKLFPKSMITPTLFKFDDDDDDIKIGSHVAVLLKENSAGSWELYNHETVDGPIHIFEYLHLFPGQIPNPITMSIP